MKYSGMEVLIMGLGLHGGGLSSACYFARHGARITVTDLRDEKTLAPAITRLEEFCTAHSSGFGAKTAPIRYVLGRHETADFEQADMVIKNPGVRPDSPFLRAAKRVETDISIFLAASPARLFAVTGSKGKSSTASALHWALEQARSRGRLPGKTLLGGNITVSPLLFLDELSPEDDVVLELSSWQLGDLRGRRREDGTPLLKPRAAVITAIMADHLDRYGIMETYMADKRIIYQGQDRADVTVAGDDHWGRIFHRESRGRPLVYAETPLPEGVSGGWLDGSGGPGLARFYGTVPPGIKEGEILELVPPRPQAPGSHQKKNLLAAGLALADLGLPAALIRDSLAAFPGIEHRLEFFYEAGGVRFYNDSAATIPEAAAAALHAFDRPMVLITGGTDKMLNFRPLAEAAPRAKALILLAGTGSDKLIPLLRDKGVAFQGPLDSIEAAAAAALGAACSGDVVILSPGCASFGMFLNEFDRGGKWKDAVKRACGAD
ncbi:MAG: UDP-N-acetylmuramoyl-L-alanine--D-glutamate ligase [Treponema sp.]|jgi:UDP-N-acetylmuramoylalanine--D-glutamate ligase|nr:UDP-N-acetylmuramoyl-L-alanine--D-glutamate ligase [Treponema sp.]